MYERCLMDGLTEYLHSTDMYHLVSGLGEAVGLV